MKESPLSHQVGADVLPFREAFAVLFFVSVSMPVNPLFLWAIAGYMLALTMIIVLGQAIVAVEIGFTFPYPARTVLVLGGRSQSDWRVLIYRWLDGIGAGVAYA